MPEETPLDQFINKLEKKANKLTLIAVLITLTAVLYTLFLAPHADLGSKFYLYSIVIICSAAMFFTTYVLILNISVIGKQKQLYCEKNLRTIFRQESARQKRTNNDS